MKKILFHYSRFNIGGAEMSNLRMMNMLVNNGWDIELALNVGGGSLEKALDKRIKIVYLKKEAYLSRYLSKQLNINVLLLIMCDIIPFIFAQTIKTFRIFGYKFKKYDVAIVGLQGLSAHFVSKIVSAKIKLQWIRNDISKSDKSGKVKRNIVKYNRYIDYYLCVSKTTLDTFVLTFPDLETKTKIFYNILNTEEMIAKSLLESNPYSQYPDAVKIITVCRMQERAKGLYRMYNVYKQLQSEGYNILWFLVGDGGDRTKLQAEVDKEENSSGFIFTGSKNNPFPYYKYADISATLSYYEGLCGTVNEAKVMGKCVIATTFSGINEQIINGENGIIVENNENAILEGFRLLLDNEELRKRLSNDYLPEAIKNDCVKIALFDQLLESK